MSALGDHSALRPGQLDIEAITQNTAAALFGQAWYTANGLAGWRGPWETHHLPIVPVITGGANYYTVREQDLIKVIALLASATTLEPGTISVAHPSRVPLTDLMRAFATQEGRRCGFLRALATDLLAAKGGEYMRLHLPFRADSLLGLITSPWSGWRGTMARLGVTLHAFTIMARRGLPDALMRILLLAQFFPPESAARSVTSSSSRTAR